jgi:hypothetical protein
MGMQIQTFTAEVKIHAKLKGREGRTLQNVVNKE